VLPHGKMHVIKSHHNGGGLPVKMKLKLVESLREPFKDEVRAIGRTNEVPGHFCVVYAISGKPPATIAWE